MEVLWGGEWTSDDPLEHLLICICTAGVPHCNAISQQVFNGGMVENQQQLLPQIVPPQYPQEVETLLCRFDDGSGICSPGEVSGDEGTEEFEGVDSFYTVSIYEKGRGVCLLFPEVQDQFPCCWC